MIITKPREWSLVLQDLADIGARRVFLVGCGQCATVARTGGEPELRAAAEALTAEGYEVTGWTVGEVACHLGGMRLVARKHADEIAAADATVVLACGAGVQTVADSVPRPVFPGLESVFLGNVIRAGVFEERCRTCGECVLDLTAGICPVTTCPKGLMNGPCGGMWEGRCEVLADRECTHVRIRRRLAEQGRRQVPVIPAKNHAATSKPGRLDLRGRAKGTGT